MKFITSLARRKAGGEITTKVRTRLNRYRLPVQLLTEDAAPFPDEIKEALRQYWQALDRYPLEAKIHEAMWEESKDDHLILSGTNFKKSMHKHPGWEKLERWLFERFKEKRLLDEKAYDLIARLVTTLLPKDFDAKHKADTIRLRVKSPAK